MKLTKKTGDFLSLAFTSVTTIFFLAATSFSVQLAGAATVSLPDTSSEQGTSVVVPMTVNPADGILAADVEFHYDSSVLTATQVTTSTGFSLVSNLNTPGVVIFSMAGTTPLSGQVQLVEITFDVIGAPGSVSPLNFISVSFNEGGVSAETVDGSVSIPGGVVATLTLPNTSAASGSTISIPITVSSDSSIGFAQFVVEYNNTVISFVNAELGGDLPGGFSLLVQPNLPFDPTTPGTNDNVLVQISSGSSSFTGTDQEVVVLNFDAIGQAGAMTPLAFDQDPTHTTLATVNGTDINNGELEFIDGQVAVTGQLGQVFAQLSCPVTVVEGCPLTTVVTIDLSQTDPQELLGTYNATLNWDPTLVEYVGFSAGDPPFNDPVVNDLNAATGELQFTQSSATGASGAVNVITVEFQVVGAPVSTGILDLSFSEMTAALTFNDLLPFTTVQDCGFEIAAGCLLGDVTLDNDATVFDALIIATNAVQLPIPPEFLAEINQGCGDVTLDNDTSVFDALVIATFAVGLPVDPFPVEQPLCP